MDVVVPSTSRRMAWMRGGSSRGGAIELTGEFKQRECKTLLNRLADSRGPRRCRYRGESSRRGPEKGEWRECGGRRTDQTSARFRPAPGLGRLPRPRSRPPVAVPASPPAGDEYGKRPALREWRAPRPRCAS